MALRVFLSHSVGVEEQALAWRLQTLAAAHGIQVYVPRRLYSQRGQSSYDSTKQVVRREIERADCVLALITNLSGTTRRTLEDELNRALALEKLVIPIVEEDVRDDKLVRSLVKSGVPSFFFPPGGNGGGVETEVARVLEKHNLSKEKRQAIGGLVALADGLLTLNAVSNK
jgi:nucleoside 2-deoxyribosyltransferase